MLFSVLMRNVCAARCGWRQPNSLNIFSALKDHHSTIFSWWKRSSQEGENASSKGKTENTNKSENAETPLPLSKSPNWQQQVLQNTIDYQVSKPQKSVVGEGPRDPNQIPEVNKKRSFIWSQDRIRNAVHQLLNKRAKEETQECPESQESKQSKQPPEFNSLWSVFAIVDKPPQNDKMSSALMTESLERSDEKINKEASTVPHYDMRKNRPHDLSDAAPNFPFWKSTIGKTTEPSERIGLRPLFSNHQYEIRKDLLKAPADVSSTPPSQKTTTEPADEILDEDRQSYTGVPFPNQHDKIWKELLKVQPDRGPSKLPPRPPIIFPECETPKKSGFDENQPSPPERHIEIRKDLLQSIGERYERAQRESADNQKLLRNKILQVLEEHQLCVEQGLQQEQPTHTPIARSSTTDSSPQNPAAHAAQSKSITSHSDKKHSTIPNHSSVLSDTVTENSKTATDNLKNTTSQLPTKEKLIMDSYSTWEQNFLRQWIRDQLNEIKRGIKNNSSWNDGTPKKSLCADYIQLPLPPGKKIPPDSSTTCKKRISTSEKIRKNLSSPEFNDFASNEEQPAMPKLHTEKDKLFFVDVNRKKPIHNKPQAREQKGIEWKDTKYETKFPSGLKRGGTFSCSLKEDDKPPTIPKRELKPLSSPKVEAKHPSNLKGEGDRPTVQTGEHITAKHLLPPCLRKKVEDK